MEQSKFNSLPRASRIKIAQRIQELVEQEIHEQAGWTLGEYYIDIMEEILGEKIGKTRSRDSVFARVVISHFLYRLGWTVSRIGKLLGRDHSTITHYGKMMDDALDTPASNPQLIWLYKKFKKEIGE